jgi:imidazoleglycerol phosphate synthase glutamine amidotransferase subunit HisH
MWYCADKLFLPGVGTAQAPMDQLREREFDRAD